MNEDILLCVSKLSTHIGNGSRAVRAVDGVSFALKRGETFALLGESGCGKSMTALSLMRLLPSSGRIVSGEVRFGARNLLTLSESEMRRVRGGGMTMIFQEPMTSLNPVLPVGTQIAEALRLHAGEDGGGAKRRVLDLLRAVRIPDPVRRFHEYPHQLSGGMKQRVMIAIALAGSPEILIADEPTTALDVTIQAQVLDLMRHLQRVRGMTILLITHDLGVVAEMAHRVAVMYAGEIVELAERQTFFTTPRHPYSHKLFDSLPTLSRRKQRLSVIRGDVPSMQDAFTGCRFAPRCDHVMPICHRKAPTWHIDGEEKVLCHLYTTQVRTPSFSRSDNQWGNHRSRRRDRSDIAPLLEVDALRVHFPIRRGIFKRTVGRVRAVDGVDLTLDTGRTLALVGESGCGKTTVGKGILQLIRPSSGSVRYENTELTRLSHSDLRRRRSHLQIIFQDPFSSMNPRMLVEDVITEGMKAQGLGADLAERRQRAEHLLRQVGLAGDSAGRYPHEFSGGQRQRISIARALSVEPRLIVCDEPTSALDISVQAQILNLLQDLQQNSGISYIFITHDMSVVSYIADEIAVMYLGCIVESGEVHEILQTPQHPYTQALLSAIPTLDSNTKRPVIRLEGDIPSPSSPPSGCYFHPRCPHAMDICKRSYPRRVQLDGRRYVHCHLFDTDTGEQ